MNLQIVRDHSRLLHHQQCRQSMIAVVVLSRQLASLSCSRLLHHIAAMAMRSISRQLVLLSIFQPHMAMEMTLPRARCSRLSNHQCRRVKPTLCQLTSMPSPPTMSLLLLMWLQASSALKLGTRHAHHQPTLTTVAQTSIVLTMDLAHRQCTLARAVTDTTRIVQPRLDSRSKSMQDHPSASVASMLTRVPPVMDVTCQSQSTRQSSSCSQHRSPPQPSFRRAIATPLLPHQPRPQAC